MSQNPYAQPTGYDVPPEAARTSVMAILSLICSLICIVPGLALLGVILAIAALSSIASARGRLGGKGLAISGLVIGVIVLALQVAAYVGWKKFNSMVGKQFIAPVSAVMTSIDQKDYTKARTLMNSSAANAVTDAEFDAFRDAYQGKLGTYQNMPSTLMEMIGAYPKVGPLMQGKSGGQPGLIPMPATFAKGMGVVWIVMDQHASGKPTSGPWTPTLLNIGVQDGPNSEVWLIQRGVPPGVSPTTPPTNPPPTGTPAPPAPAGGNGG